eukprot:GHVU01118337.1.p4 GENE.GHVU01118337.1~~GHVU01118337.1.p4  ORF type:complete len:112 (+),score=17.54 GHVU01118337.1:1993-2328(+)
MPEGEMPSPILEQSQQEATMIRPEDPASDPPSADQALLTANSYKPDSFHDPTYTAAILKEYVAILQHEVIGPVVPPSSRAMKMGWRLTMKPGDAPDAPPKPKAMVLQGIYG